MFSYLTVSDKNKVRRTCSSWYDICNRVSILREEVISIYKSTRKPEQIFRTLANSKRMYFNIKFYKFNFFDDVLPLWEKCSPRIYSLTFGHCLFNKESSLMKLIYSCQNLQHLHIKDCNYEAHFNNDLSREVPKKKLISLRVTLYYPTSDYLLTQIFDMYKNIEELALNLCNTNCHKRVDDRFYGRDKEEKNTAYNSKDINSFSCIFSTIKSNSSTLKKLSLKSILLTDYWFYRIASLPDLR